MTVEQIDKQIAELKAKKKEKLQKQKQKKLLEQRLKNARKRKLESRVKYIIGGYVLALYPNFIDYHLEHPELLREQDRKTLAEYKSLN